MTHELREKPGHLIWRAYQLTWQLFGEEAGDLEITPVQEASLLVLAKRNNIDQKTLAQLVALDRSTAGNVIGRLEERGLISRVQNDSDRRARLLSLTTKGEALSRKLRPIALRAATRLLAPLTPLERGEFVRLLRKVTGLADHLDMVGPSGFGEQRLAGKRVLLIGLDDAMGEQVAESVRGEGAKVAELARPVPPEAPGRAERFSEQLAAALRELRGVDVLVNGGNLAASQVTGRNSDEVHAHIQQTSGARLTAISRVLPHLIDNGHTRIINLALFPAVTLPPSLVPAVFAANASIAAITRRIAIDQRRHGIVCNCLTPRLEPVASVDGANQTGQSRFAPVAAIDVAQATCFLASSESRAISGSLLEIG